jgi:hypothetical protein
MARSSGAAAHGARSPRRDYDRRDVDAARSRSIRSLAGTMIAGLLIAACGGASTATPLAVPSPAGPTPTSSAAVPSESPSAAAATGSGTAAASGQAAPFALTSPAFRDGGPIPREFTCDGAGGSPALRWSGVPSGAAALVLEVIDIDASFIHWLVLDLPPTSPGSLAAGVGTGSGDPQQGTNSFGQVGWGGPCPPSGTHHYVFVLSALAAPLGLSGHPSPRTVENAIAAGTLLGRARLTGTYRRG